MHEMTMTENKHNFFQVDYEYDTGHLIPDWRNSAPAGTYLVNSGGPKDSPGWISFQDRHLQASGGVDLMRQAELREQHPALQEAWQQYLALLHVCNDK
jgi:hypothetical protein